ncbi:hypothetical protein [Rhizobium sp. R693]|uniref:hypothetical protein n=1 Tax=Rhizobium sp. R693 TaxID=1764276 RepID=UPI000B52CB9D|nr:hypothetical protein [Rhizobium sp. R693]OWV98760.1 hypothetical protein ATY79_19040 [Rhizobium sp. R693]
MTSRLIRFYACTLVLSLLAPAAAQPEDVNRAALGRTIYSVDADTLDRFPTAAPVSVEVMWCGGDEFARSREVVAAEIASSIATFARLNNPNSVTRDDSLQFLYRTVRVRPINLHDSSISKSAIGSTIIEVPTPDLQRSAELIGSATGLSIPISINDQLWPNYLRVTVCESVDIDEVPPRIFVHISAPDQELSAKQAINALQAGIESVIVSHSIEKAGEMSPSTSQIRYFYRPDEVVATRVRDIVSQAIGPKAGLDLVYLPDFAKDFNRGTVEVWLGNSLRPRPSATYYVCEGEHGGKCPPGSEHISCYTPLEVWAKQKPGCRYFEKVRLTVVGGNRCGYDISRITCYPE